MSSVSPKRLRRVVMDENVSKNRKSDDMAPMTVTLQYDEVNESEISDRDISEDSDIDNSGKISATNRHSLRHRNLSESSKSASSNNSNYKLLYYLCCMQYN